MADLLIHSMSEFSDVILKCLDAASARDIVEIGCEFGGMSDVLATFTRERRGSLTTIDPSPKAAFSLWLKEQNNVQHIAAPSLDVIANLPARDAWMIDGDHNWYTVFHELLAIDALCLKYKKPLLVFLHDVGWPCARRDLYYAPDKIPEQYRHDYDFEGGMSLDTTFLLPNQGFRGHGSFAAAKQYGGPRNGVLTAIEDFVAQAITPTRKIDMALVPAVFGLGVLYDQSALWSDDVATILAPLHLNKLLASLEENRLRNYLTVIEWQDRQHK